MPRMSTGSSSTGPRARVPRSSASRARPQQSAAFPRDLVRLLRRSRRRALFGRRDAADRSGAPVHGCDARRREMARGAHPCAGTESSPGPVSGISAAALMALRPSDGRPRIRRGRPGGLPSASGKTGPDRGRLMRSRVAPSGRCTSRGSGPRSWRRRRASTGCARGSLGCSGCGAPSPRCTDVRRGT